MTDERRFADELIAAEQMTPSYRERYERELRATFEGKLTRALRFIYALFAVFGLLNAVFFGGITLVSTGLPYWGRACFALGALFCLSLAAVFSWIAWKGTLKLRTLPTHISSAGWGFVIIIITIFMVFTGFFRDVSHLLRGILMMVDALVFLIMATYSMISNCIDQAELRMREKLLGIELCLAQMAEEIAKKQHP